MCTVWPQSAPPSACNAPTNTETHTFNRQSRVVQHMQQHPTTTPQGTCADLAVLSTSSGPQRPTVGSLANVGRPCRSAAALSLGTAKISRPMHTASPAAKAARQANLAPQPGVRIGPSGLWHVVWTCDTRR